MDGYLGLTGSLGTYGESVAFTRLHVFEELLSDYVLEGCTV